MEQDIWKRLFNFSPYIKVLLLYMSWFVGPSLESNQAESSGNGNVVGFDSTAYLINPNQISRLDYPYGSVINDSSGLYYLNGSKGSGADQYTVSNKVTDPDQYGSLFCSQSIFRCLLLSVVLGVLIITTIVGNSFVIAAVILERNLQGVANYLIVSLAVADLTVAIMVPHCFYLFKNKRE